MVLVTDHRRTVTAGITVDPDDPRTLWVGDTAWRLWQSDTGWLHATRAGDVTEDQVNRGYVRTLDAKTRWELEHKMLDQPDAPKAEG